MPTHLPGNGSWFRLIGAAGQETLYIVASTQPLTQEQVREEVERAAVLVPARVAMTMAEDRAAC